MEIFECGLKVLIKMNFAQAIITGVTIRFKAIAYELSYFDNNNEYKQIWMNEKEFQVEESNVKTKIGFIKY